jgi:hypothetical protein
MSLFSFIKHPVESYVNELLKLYPGITDAYGCFTDYDHKLKIISLKNDKFIFIQEKEIIRNFIRFSKKLNNQNWLNNESLPIHDVLRIKELKQMKLEDEDKNSWLVLKTKSSLSSAFDIVLLRINNSNTFGVNHKLKNYNTTQKALIANLINSNFQHFINITNDNYKALSLMNKSLNQLNEIVSVKNINNELSDKKYREIFIQYIEQTINKTSNKLGFKIIYNEEFIDSVINSKFDLSQIENTIKQSIYICINSNIQNKRNIELKPEHLIWPSKTLSNLSVKHRDNSLVELLDRYEVATTKAYNQGLKIIGNTVGECCQPSVSAASISFNLKKYENKIFNLLEENQEQWLMLRNQFKPIKNILNKGSKSIDKIKLA